MAIKSEIESLLFISPNPISIRKISDLTKKEFGEVKIICDDLVKKYKEEKRGMQIIENKQQYQMVSSPENSNLVQKFIKIETTGELTKPSLETLTIIAYRAPISKIDLDRIRGVNCSLVLRNLMIRGLIEAKHHKIKDSIYYSPSFDFIRFLGVSNISELPDFEKLSKDDAIERMLDG